MKKLAAKILIAALAIGCFMPMSAAPAEAKTSLKSTYSSFVKKQLQKGMCDGAEKFDCWMYDFNKDGTKELIVEFAGGARNLYYAYTYYKGKVKYLTDGNGFYYQKDKKYLISYGSGGFQDFDYTAYKISKGKAKKSFKYACDAGVYKKDGKEIDKKTFTDFQDTLKSNIGKSFTVSKYEYTSPKKIGFNLLKLGTTDTYIKKLSKDKVSYYTIKWDPETGKTIKKSKTKTAKITSSTKYYVGDTQLLFSGKLKGKDVNAKKWLKKASKSDFKKALKANHNDYVYIKLSKGKVKYIVTDIHIAD